ncbi:MAG: MBL fold metallo-hydrolase [Chloroflexota bacterium]
MLPPHARVADRLTYLGHSTVLLELAGVQLLTDRQRVGPCTEGPIDPQWTRVDAVPSRTRTGTTRTTARCALSASTCRCSCPRGWAPASGARGFRHVEELSPGQTTAVGAVRVEATEAAHRGFPRPRRHPTDLAIGFLLQAGSMVYFPGDTALFEGMTGLARDPGPRADRCGAGGRGRSRTSTSTRSARRRALQLLRPKVAVPAPTGARSIRSASSG